MPELPESGVQLVAKDADKFQRDLDNAKKRVSNFGADSKKAASVGLKDFNDRLNQARSGLQQIAGGNILGGLQSLIGMFGPLAAAAGLVVGAVAGIAIQINKMIEQSRQAIKTVDGLADRFQLTAKEAGTVVNFAQIMGVQVGTLTTAFRFLARRGLEPSIAGLIEARNRIQAIEDPGQRATMTIRLLGRSGLQLAEIMNLNNQEFNKWLGLARQAALITEEATEQQDQYNRQINAYRTLTTNANAISTAQGRVTKDAISLFWEEQKALGSVNIALGSMVTLRRVNMHALDDQTRRLVAALEARKLDLKLSWERVSAMAAETDRLTALAASYGKFPSAVMKGIDDLEDVAEQIEAVMPKPPSIWETVFPDPADLATKIAEQIAFIEAGGPQIVAAIQRVQQGLAEGALRPEEALPLLDDLQEAALSIAVEAGDITAWEAAKRNAEDFGGPIRQARLDIQAAKAVIDDLPREISIRIHLLQEKLPGFQHGGSFVVGGQLGADANLVAFRATRGERVTVTPPSIFNQQRYDNRQLSIGNIGGGFDPNDSFAVDRMIREWFGA